ncbi:MAG: hypothetical protein GY820_40285 [Gammaproteobacteria bacterium]|nr:hypothetical protein [Gammaproteobacteria bacterium]
MDRRVITWGGGGGESLRTRDAVFTRLNWKSAKNCLHTCVTHAEVLLSYSKAIGLSAIGKSRNECYQVFRKQLHQYLNFKIAGF